MKYRLAMQCIFDQFPQHVLDAIHYAGYSRYIGPDHCNMDNNRHAVGVTIEYYCHEMDRDAHLQKFHENVPALIEKWNTLPSNENEWIKAAFAEVNEENWGASLGFFKWEVLASNFDVNEDM